MEFKYGVNHRRSGFDCVPTVAEFKFTGKMAELAEIWDAISDVDFYNFLFSRMFVMSGIIGKKRSSRRPSVVNSTYENQALE